MDYKASLLADGYEEVESLNGIRAGSRVRNAAHQYPEAVTGTATVLGVYEHPSSSFAQKYGRDVEILVRRDADGSEGLWQDYRTVAAEAY